MSYFSFFSSSFSSCQRAPGLLSLSLAGVLSACLPGCVLQSQHAQARDALVREREAHHQTASQLMAMREHLAAVERERDQTQALAAERTQRIEAAEQSIAQLELDASVVLRERQEATELVEQLRSELERVA